MCSNHGNTCDANYMNKTYPIFYHFTWNMSRPGTRVAIKFKVLFLLLECRHVVAGFPAPFKENEWRSRAVVRDIEVDVDYFALLIVLIYLYFHCNSRALTD